MMNSVQIALKVTLVYKYGLKMQLEGDRIALKMATKLQSNRICKQAFTLISVKDDSGERGLEQSPSLTFFIHMSSI